MTCECGTKMVHRGYEHVQNVAGVLVRDATAHVWQCLHCGEVLLSMKELSGYERRAAALVLWEGGNRVTGATLKFARKALGLKQAELGKLLDVRAETVSHWENGHDAPLRATQVAISHLLNLGKDGGEIPELAARLRGDESGVELTVSPRLSRMG
jgi:DNA-binding XRE family transcriptional regulator